MLTNVARIIETLKGNSLLYIHQDGGITVAGYVYARKGPNGPTGPSLDMFLDIRGGALVTLQYTFISGGRPFQRYFKRVEGNKILPHLQEDIYKDGGGLVEALIRWGIIKDEAPVLPEEERAERDFTHYLRRVKEVDGVLHMEDRKRGDHPVIWRSLEDPQFLEEKRGKYSTEEFLSMIPLFQALSENPKALKRRLIQRDGDTVRVRSV